MNFWVFCFALFYLTELFSLTETEKRERIEGEKSILQKLDDESFSLKEILD